jgi:hypothetical protein
MTAARPYCGGRQTRRDVPSSDIGMLTAELAD